MSITYKTNASLSAEQFIALLYASGLAGRRPVEDRACMEGMVRNSNLTVTAWDGDKLIGVARAMTDFHYACYLSDLAVDKNYQKSGVGKKLQSITQQQLGPRCKLILIAAPTVNSYYEQLGYTHNPRCWVLDRERDIDGWHE